MRKLIYSMFVSLDGYIETRNREIDWSAPDDEVHGFVNEQSRKAGTWLYGRRLYELMAAYWPTAASRPDAPAVEVEFARIWKATPKVVFSTTLREVGWNSRLVRGNLAEEVVRLKNRPGGDIEVGGPRLAWQLVRLGLVDEYRLFVHPVVLGGGTPFFPDLDDIIRLRRVETRSFNSGITYLRYLAAG